MRNTRTLFRITLVITLFLIGVSSFGQKQERMKIQANMRGTGTQMGQLYNVNISIEQFSSPVDQKVLIDAFNKSGNEGIVNALTKMSPKGRISPTFSVGNDVKYIREFPSEKGRRFRLVTDRNISFGEARGMTRSKDYSLSAVDITITPDGKKSFGTFLPACKLKLNKKKEIEIEALQNPWKLSNIVVHRDD